MCIRDRPGMCLSPYLASRSGHGRVRRLRRAAAVAREEAGAAGDAIGRAHARRPEPAAADAGPGRPVAGAADAGPRVAGAAADARGDLWLGRAPGGDARRGAADARRAASSGDTRDEAAAECYPVLTLVCC